MAVAGGVSDGESLADDCFSQNCGGLLCASGFECWDDENRQAVYLRFSNCLVSLPPRDGRVRPFGTVYCFSDPEKQLSQTVNRSRFQQDSKSTSIPVGT